MRKRFWTKKKLNELIEFRKRGAAQRDTDVTLVQRTKTNPNKIIRRVKVVESKCWLCETWNRKTAPFCEECLKKHLQLEIKPSEGRGEGLFVVATEDKKKHSNTVFRKGDVILPYLGDVWKQEMWDARFEKGDQHIGGPYAVSAMFVDNNGTSQSVVVDCLRRRSAASMVNSVKGRKNEKPNAEMNCYTGGTMDEVWIEARCDIKPGEEILVDYGNDYDWNAVVSIEQHL